MRRWLIALGLLIGLTAPAYAQSPDPSDTQAPTPQTPTAPASTPQTPSPPAATPEAEVWHSLFDIAPNQLLLGGRVSSIDGDPARYQRYQDLRDGLLFTGARFTHEDPAGAWLLKAGADNVGWRDQRYFANYERTGRLKVTGLWDQIPQFYSVDTKTPYTGSGGTLVLDDTTQRAIQSGQANLNAYVPIAPQFDLRERRDIGRVDVVATPKPKLDVTASFTTQKHNGELPWGASFGFSNDVEVPLPYDSRTNDLTIGTEWTNTKNMLRVAYSGSWFDNLADPLVWDSPLRLDDAPGSPGRGRMSLWPSNSAQTISFGGYTKLAHKTQVTGFFSYGLWSNDEPLQPFTINSALPPIALPRGNADAEAHVFSTNLNLDIAPHQRLAVQRALPQLHLLQPHAGDEHYAVRRLRLERVDDADRRSRSFRPRPDHVRRGRDLEQDEPARADRRLHPQRQRLRRADLSVEQRGRVSRVGRRGGNQLGHIPGPIRGREPQGIGPGRAGPDRHRRAPGDAAI